jgi:hypothetical protein
VPTKAGWTRVLMRIHERTDVPPAFPQNWLFKLFQNTRWGAPMRWTGVPAAWAVAQHVLASGVRLGEGWAGTPPACSVAAASGSSSHPAMCAPRRVLEHSIMRNSVFDGDAYFLHVQVGSPLGQQRRPPACDGPGPGAADRVDQRPPALLRSAPLMAVQERLLLKDGADKWRQAYYMPGKQVTGSLLLLLADELQPACRACSCRVAAVRWALPALGTAVGPQWDQQWDSRGNPLLNTACPPPAAVQG